MNMDSDKLEVMKSIVRENFEFSWGKIYYYSIAEKYLAKLIKNFDPYLDTGNVVAFYDSTLTGNCKNGIIFTLTGIYQREILDKPVYINYKDITTVNIIPDKKGDVCATDAKLDIFFRK